MDLVGKICEEEIRSCQTEAKFSQKDLNNLVKLSKWMHFLIILLFWPCFLSFTFRPAPLMMINLRKTAHFLGKCHSLYFLFYNQVLTIDLLQCKCNVKKYILNRMIKVFFFVMRKNTQVILSVMYRFSLPSDENQSITRKC